MEDKNTDQRCYQDHCHKKLDHMMLFEKMIRTAGEQQEKADHCKCYIDIIVSPLSFQRHIVNKENIVHDQETSGEKDKYPVIFRLIQSEKDKNAAQDKKYI